ncbi:MAG: nucleotidyltransferase [Rhodocyclales bacterium]|nr:nucleotidyltransferase [Rhodocyclales bacterium]
MLSRDFKEFVASLNANGVDYLVVGGYAMAMHGRPRHTGDLDVWIEPGSANASRLMRALDDFGFGGLGLAVDDFTTPDRVVQLGYPPFRIDLLTSIDGVDFAAAWARREQVEHDGLRINFIGLEDLKANKRASGRPRDIDDLDNLP